LAVAAQVSNSHIVCKYENDIRAFVVWVGANGEEKYCRSKRNFFERKHSLNISVAVFIYASENSIKQLNKYFIFSRLKRFLCFGGLKDFPRLSHLRIYRK
jgi:hypothetical protein